MHADGMHKQDKYTAQLRDVKIEAESQFPIELIETIYEALNE
jgi:hypothetical protein